jgi:hypothetical protein
MEEVILLALMPKLVNRLCQCATRLGLMRDHHVDRVNVIALVLALPASIIMATTPSSRVDISSQASLYLILGAVYSVRIYRMLFPESTYIEDQ